jgi:hypothetical protein
MNLVGARSPCSSTFHISAQISAAGGLLSHFSRAKARGELPGGDSGTIPVNGIEVFTPFVLLYFHHPFSSGLLTGLSPPFFIGFSEAFMQLNADTLEYVFASQFWSSPPSSTDLLPPPFGLAIQLAPDL